MRRFRQILTERDETALQPWAYEAEASQIPELVRFVQRLRPDWEAVENALLFASSQGQVEGQMNRLKVFKRQAMDEPPLLSYRLAWCKQVTSTKSVHDPQNLLTFQGIYQLGQFLSSWCLPAASEPASECHRAVVEVHHAVAETVFVQ